MARICMLKRFERFWRWAQAALIIFMPITGFEIHGSYALIGRQKAADLHTVAAWTVIGPWLLAIPEKHDRNKLAQGSAGEEVLECGDDSVDVGR